MDDQKQQTILGPDCRIAGDVSLDNDAIVLGQVRGTLHVGGMLELAESSVTQGTIIAGALRLGGKANADVVAEHGTELLEGAHLSGELFTTRLSVVEGAVFEGDVCVGPKAMDAASETIQRVHQREQQAFGDAQPKPTYQAKHQPQHHNAPGDINAGINTVPSSLDTVLQRRRNRPNGNGGNGNGNGNGNGQHAANYQG